MIFENLTDFGWMGGHGPYVWSAYGVALLIIGYNLFSAVANRRRVTEMNQKRRSQERGS